MICQTFKVLNPIVPVYEKQTGNIAYTSKKRKKKEKK